MIKLLLCVFRFNWTFPLWITQSHDTNRIQISFVQVYSSKSSPISPHLRRSPITVATTRSPATKVYPINRCPAMIRATRPSNRRLVQKLHHKNQIPTTIRITRNCVQPMWTMWAITTPKCGANRRRVMQTMDTAVLSRSRRKLPRTTTMTTIIQTIVPYRIRMSHKPRPLNRITIMRALLAFETMTKASTRASRPPIKRTKAIYWPHPLVRPFPIRRHSHRRLVRAVAPMAHPALTRRSDTIRYAATPKWQLASATTNRWRAANPIPTTNPCAIWMRETEKIHTNDCTMKTI